MDKRTTFLGKKCRGGVRGDVETETTMSAGEGPSSRRPRAPGIEDNQNAKRCRNWIHARAGEMAAKREAKRRWSEPNSRDEGPRLDPLGF
jgi:hypothetical protein